MKVAPRGDAGVSEAAAEALQEFLQLATAAAAVPYLAVAVGSPGGGYDLFSSRGRARLACPPLETSGALPSPSPFADCPEARHATVVPVAPEVWLYLVDGDVSEAMRRLLVQQVNCLQGAWQESRLFAVTPQPTWIADAETGRFLAVNDAALEQYGYRREQFLSMRVADLHPADEAPLFQHLSPLALGASGRIGPMRHLTRDGSVVEVEVLRTAVRWGGQEARLGCPQDITAARVVEDALRASEARFRRLTEATFEGIVIHTDGRIVEVNAGAARMFGYTVDAMVGMPVMALLAPESRQPVEERIRAGVEAAADYRALRQDGSTFLAEVVSRNHSYRGRTYRLVAVRDISESRAAEMALRASEERFRAIFTRSGVGIALLNSEGRALQCNPALCRILATSEDRIVGHTARAFTEPEDMPSVVTRFRELAEGQREHFSMERRFRRGDGGRGWAHTTVSAVRAENRTMTFAVCLVEDVTQRRADEAERRRLEEQLVQAQKVEAIGRLAGGVAHDFNNLLTTIQGYADLLRTELCDSPALHHFAQEIVDTTEQAAGLTRQLLAFSRKQPLVASPIGVNSVVLDMEEILQRLLPSNVELSVSLAPDTGAIMADAVQLKQVILNLVVNARDAMPAGGRLSVSTTRIEPDQVCLEVADNGTGMSDEVKAHLFEPFYTTKPHGQGTGLGLATSYGIVRQSRGHFAVDSRPGEGSIFRVYFPRLGDSPQAEAPPPPPAQPPRGGFETVLVVEDTRPLRELVTHVLRGLGYAVLEAADGEEAVGLLTARPEVGPDLLLTDVLMPCMGGEELARWVKERSPSTRVLYMSGHNEVPGLQQGDLAPGVALLSKPFAPAHLAEAVRTVLDG
ncbi:MAG TPA: PAS domain S-box protein [Candidatus Xenobia bacterium]|jgi:PAS domain S-box-containing protein